MEGRNIYPKLEVEELEAAGVFGILNNPEEAREYIGDTLWHLEALVYHFDRFRAFACNKHRELFWGSSVAMDAEVVSFIFSLHSLMEGVPYGVAVCLDSRRFSMKSKNGDLSSYSWKEYYADFSALDDGHEFSRLRKLIKRFRGKTSDAQFINKEYELLHELANVIKHRSPIRLTLPQHLQNDMSYRRSSKELGTCDLVFRKTAACQSGLIEGQNVMDALVRMHDNLTFTYTDIRVELLRLMHLVK